MLNWTSVSPLGNCNWINIKASHWLGNYFLSIVNRIIGYFEIFFIPLRRPAQLLSSLSFTELGQKFRIISFLDYVLFHLACAFILVFDELALEIISFIFHLLFGNQFHLPTLKVVLAKLFLRRPCSSTWWCRVALCWLQFRMGTFLRDLDRMMFCSSRKLGLLDLLFKLSAFLIDKWILYKCKLIFILIIMEILELGVVNIVFSIQYS